MNSKVFYLSKTFWINAITGILAVLALPEFVSLLSPAYLPYVALANVIGNVYLRSTSTTNPLTLTDQNPK